MLIRKIRTVLSLLVFVTVFSNMNAQEKINTPIKSPDKIAEIARSQVTKIYDSTLKSIVDAGEQFLLIDVRTEQEYLAGHIKGAVWIPRGMLEFAIQDVTKNQNAKMVLYCRTGGRSALSVVTLTEMGYKNVNSLTGGFKEWVESGYSVYNRHGEVKVIAFEIKENEEIRSMPGGWSTTEVTPEVEKALDYVLKRINTAAKLEKILEVRTQVVAGINYDIDFQLDDGEVWNTIVFRDLSGNYTMTKPASLKNKNSTH